jgi:hypothetical protein
MDYHHYFYADDGFGNLIQISDSCEQKYYSLFSDCHPNTHKNAEKK